MYAGGNDPGWMQEDDTGAGLEMSVWILATVDEEASIAAKCFCTEV